MAFVPQYTYTILCTLSRVVQHTLDDVTRAPWHLQLTQNPPAVSMSSKRYVKHRNALTHGAELGLNRAAGTRGATMQHRVSAAAGCADCD